ncbi:MAG: bifunctional [glutamate--ammonia ligase]-adenylyl-L-tyrosine phosphorylase/[glutamate--ammonia-ligase] adenylyltransferase [Gammaproteobacteria bacterium]|nr:MAG: bifunctional [glutamate--ammonia ligase]-adenylyl-L-tyrosine phosphorylase/[glutamate--ammonia-ligase] adenylyltransferase [Gammaproteobacteria bacterium]
MSRLRRRRRREMLRIAWRDIGALASLEQTLAETSAFADAVLSAALARLHEWQCAELGVPHSLSGEPQFLSVIALGKLGGEELNFSSDIDLVFAFAEPGQTTGARRSVANDEYFIRLGQRLINILSTQTGDGQVFRVDMRLRPFGNSGPLAMSFDAAVDYYQTHGRDWERYAWIKARSVTAGHGERLLAELQPFIYRRYIDFGALESLREMKEMIAAEVQRKGMAGDVKLGPGGIREIEFIGQVFQLVRGGKVARLRERSILNVLPALAELDHLPAYAVSQLVAAYHFLRTTEHRLQQMEDRQTHLLPEDDATQEQLAAAAGLAHWEDFQKSLAVHRTVVQSHFDQVFAAPQTDLTTESSTQLALWHDGLPESEALRILQEMGFANAPAAWGQIGKLRGTYSVRHLTKRGHERFEHLMPLLLAAVVTRGEAEATLARVFNVIETIATRSVYLALLVERPLALSQLVRLCHASPWIARQIARHPLLLDELLDPRTLYAPPRKAALQSDLRARMESVTPGDTEQEMEVVRQFKQVNVLRVAAADVSEAVALMVVSDHLSEIAEVVLENALEIVWRDVTNRYGEPTCLRDGIVEKPGFIIVAYGKLGGIELGYGSDLDLVFLHGSEGEQQQTSGPKVVDNAVFFGRLGQRLINFLTAHMPAGRLYEVDFRLRPSGASGLLVSSLRAFESYQHADAWTWEHQALVRARVVAGDRGLASQFESIRRELLQRHREPEQLRTEVHDMRIRMRHELSTREPGRFDLKQDPGGIADIEFMVQYGVLLWATQLGGHLDFSDNIRLLDGLVAEKLLPTADARMLADAYRTYRARVHAAALQEQLAVVPDDEYGDLRAGVLNIWDGLLGNQPADDERS